MINKKYWDNFYKLNLAPKVESSFARFVYDFITAQQLNSPKLIDVACGNGRDTFFFQQNGIESAGVDISVKPNTESPIFIKENILDFDYSPYDIIYLRFIVHALKEEELEQLISQIKRSQKEQLIFIETRSSKKITDEPKSETYFKSPIGEKHFRMLYSEEYLTTKLKEHFYVELVKEDHGFAIYKGADPVCIRYVLKNEFNKTEH